MSLNFISACSTQTDKQLTFSSKVISSGWKIQSSEKMADTEDQAVSQNGFDVSGWHNGVVPGTVMGALSEFNVIEDATFGINMKNLDPTQFQIPWWYRTSFELSANDLAKDVSLRFNGICYRADLWVNGKKVVGMETFAGTYRMFTFNINSYIQEGENTMALKMVQFADGEYSLGFCDWNPLPTDRSMGIFREVFLEINEGVKIRSPFVYSKVDNVSKSAADLFIQAEIVNSSDKPVEGIFRVDYEVGQVEKKVVVKANDTLSVRLNPEEFSQLSVKNIELWWPNGMGNAKLYKLKTEFIVGNKVVDEVEKKYGI
ncbi:MAG: beta galactosidase jelly roll domain-containing protein, partial [Bacteroidetes bacterium]|nr:beta galactosidase jelly roll domain-containing protein [Bacteroidota bacterium]